VPGTNVHWGDCVSTSSKLGEDLGDSEDIIISAEVYDAVKGTPAAEAFAFDESELQTSGVLFKCYKVSRAASDSASPPDKADTAAPSAS
jgi:hypothetical protein